ncbi:hypothetical protein DSECCO2_599520 [anaerobic digester metagenome]
MPHKFHAFANLQTTRAFEHLNVSLISQHLDHLGHQPGSVQVDITDLVLGNRPADFHNYQVGNNTGNDSGCLFIFFHLLY